MREKERANRQWQGIRPRSIEVQARGQERRERERELSENPNWRVSEGNTDRRERSKAEAAFSGTESTLSCGGGGSCPRS